MDTKKIEKVHDDLMRWCESVKEDEKDGSNTPGFVEGVFHAVVQIRYLIREEFGIELGHQK